MFVTPLVLTSISVLVNGMIGFCGESARDVLMKSLDSKLTISCTVIQTQGSPGPGKEAFQTKLQFDGRGRSRRTVLQPLRMQGIVSIDDGKTWSTYLPDEKKIMVQPSPIQHRQSTRQRMGLIDQNYVIKFDKSIELAGRKAYTIVAVPKNKELDTRRFVIDMESYLPLRQEAISASGKVRTMFDTLALTLQGRQDPGSFRVPKPPGVSVVQFPAPEPIVDLQRAEDAIGFEPRNPESLPYGFSIQEWHILGGESMKFICVRLSDGFSSVSIYQWDSKKPGKRPPFRRSDAKDSEGVSYSIMGDVPSAVRDKLVDTFKRAGHAP